MPRHSQAPQGGRTDQSRPTRRAQLVALPRLKATDFRTTHRDRHRKSSLPRNRLVPGTKATKSRRTRRDRDRRPFLPASSSQPRTKRVRSRPLLFSAVSSPAEIAKSPSDAADAKLQEPTALNTPLKRACAVSSSSFRVPSAVLRFHTASFMDEALTRRHPRLRTPSTSSVAVQELAPAFLLDPRAVPGVRLGRPHQLATT